MNVFSYRKHLRFLSPSQRRIWWDQKKRLTPRVKIGGAYVPQVITHHFIYVKVSCRGNPSAGSSRRPGVQVPGCGSDTSFCNQRLPMNVGAAAVGR